MTKLRIVMSLAALAAALFLLVFDASQVRTMVIEEPTNQGQQHQDCGQEIQQQDTLIHCQDYMWEQVQRGGSRQGQPHFETCCDQLSDLRVECTCEGLGRAINQMQQKPQQSGQKWFVEALDLARDLPIECSIAPIRCIWGTLIR